MKNFLNL